MATKKRAPVGLQAKGKALWDQITGKYELRVDELAKLEDACRMTDTAAALEAAWIAEGRQMTARGSMGQLVEHPMLGSMHKYRMARNQLLAGLKLPDDPAGEGEGTAPANQARAAAQSRWSAAHGS